MLTVGDIKTWADREVAPMAWYRISLRLAPTFRSHGVMGFLLAHTPIKEQELIQRIDDEFYSVYRARLPQSLKQKAQ